MPSAQLTFDGREEPRPEAGARRLPDLTGVQSEVVRFVVAYGVITSTQVGRIAHGMRERACRHHGSRGDRWTGRGAGCCAYCASDGAEVAARLVTRGLLEHGSRRGQWVLARKQRIA